MAIYMQIDGIKGNVEAEGHADWIECLSMQWGVGRGIQAKTGSSKDREASAPSISELDSSVKSLPAPPSSDEPPPQAAAARATKTPARTTTVRW